MSREIKFRGIRKDNDEWVYGYFFKTADDRYWITINNKDKTYGDIEVIPESVGMYIELKDKNNKEIYEGDIIKYSHEDNTFSRSFIRYKFGMWETIPIYESSEYILKKDREELVEPLTNVFVESNLSKTSLFKVIGNIYEDKKLLEKQNEL